MQTQINWIKYEGRTEGLNSGYYLVFGQCIKEGKITKEVKTAYLNHGRTDLVSGVVFYPKWSDLDSFIIEYITPLSEIEKGLVEEIKQN